MVTVYEVGTASGRDFVAMELICGETLAEWLRVTRRPLTAVLDALLAAGRGLAAAQGCLSGDPSRSSLPGTIPPRPPTTASVAVGRFVLGDPTVIRRTLLRRTPRLLHGCALP